MKKYKLIKKYPYSPELGDIVSEFETIFEKYPEFWQEVKEPLFITEDNVPIYEGEDYWIVPNDLNGFWKTDSKAYEKRKDSLFFSSRKSAEKWIEQNKPVFSRKQVLDAIEKVLLIDIGGTIVRVKDLKKELGI